MRNFAYKNPDFIKNEVVPELIEDNPCHQQSVYDSVMYDETSDGDLIQSDMTQILLNQEKYRRLLGDMNVQNNPGRNVSGALGYNLRYWQWKSNIDTVHAGFRAGAAYQSWAAPLDGWQVLTSSGAWSDSQQ